ncbi:hypothetical protein [uncultured Algibacter sp.]|uniref:hypothetical protein n=1 Tax=uncultured Algibacter sp. TaxID=298659 RepID=UPI00260A71E7|nr:hypothetical protein [uncultured Algibacter sp.]
MRILKSLFNFYINSSIHVALAVYALTWITLLELGLKYDEVVLYFMFYATITGYNFVKYFGIAKFRHRRLAKWLRLIQVLSFVCFLFMCFYAYQLQIKTLWVIVFFAVVTFFYAIPFFKKGQYTLRNINGVKVYVIALVWSGATVFIPLINIEYELSTDVLLLGTQRFLYVLVLMIPFEIRDLKFDDSKLKTIPQSIGVNQTKTLGIFMLLICSALEFFKDDLISSSIITLLLITILTGGFVIFSRVEQGKYYSSFWVEALPIFWLVLLLILI